MFGGQVELGVICISMEVDVVPAKYMDKRKEVNEK